MPKENKTSNKDGGKLKKKISLKKLIRESVSMKKYPEEQQKLLDQFPTLLKEKKQELREVFENELEKREKMEKQEKSEKRKLINKAKAGLQDFQKGQKRKKRKKAEEKDRYSEEKFAKDLLSKLDSFE